MIILIQARSNSERFPNKIYQMIKGRPLIFHSIDIAAKSEAKYFVGIHYKDYKLEQYLMNNKVPFFKGSENDVLDRFYQFAKNIKTNFIVRMTADYIYNEDDFWEIINLYKKRKRFTWGLGLWVFSFEELKRAWTKTTIPAQREDVCLYMLDTVDYIEDLGKWNKD